MKRIKLRHVRHKSAKGRVYYYFDTGQKNDRGGPILIPLPPASDPRFLTAVERARVAREGREVVADGLLTVAGMADLWEKSPDFRKKAAKTQLSYRLNLQKIRERIGEAPADDLTPADVRHVRDEMAEAPGAANQIVRVIGALYKWGRSYSKVAARPAYGVEELDGGEHDPWPQWLIDLALASDDPLIKLSVALLYYTAQRIGDVCKLRWTDIRDNRIEIVQEKGGREMSIPLHRALAGILGDAPRAALTVISRGDRPHTADSLRRLIQIWAKEAGVRVVPHGLRKNAVNALLEAGCSAAETAAISGQSLQMVEHYAKKRDTRKLSSAAILRWERAGNKKRK